ncbi:MAG: deoxyribodipyrimidine photo-lyase [Bacteroidia bacterium]
MSFSIFWFRRDLRLEDNAGLYQALKNNEVVLPIFIFDTTILNKLVDKSDKRVDFIHQAISSLGQQLQKYGSSLRVYVGEPLEIFKNICDEYKITSVYTNNDYEPDAIIRDDAIQKFLAIENVAFNSYKDQCVFEKHEITKDDGLPYTIFTPYAVKWKKKMNEFYQKSYPTSLYVKHLHQTKPFIIPSLHDIGFKKTELTYLPPAIDEALISKYTDQRNFPAIKGTTQLSVHLRFGTISIRQLLQKAITLNETWLNELIWRDFYMMILFHFPHVVEGAFKSQYNFINWRNNEAEFNAWCEGNTGYPIVDAGMKELNETGFMHNRVRMIVASFLVKHLLIDWRWGEAYFAQKLLDFDLSANNGGWQWAASSGCDAVPYFRIFNPYEQTRKFDSELKYIKKWLPNYDELTYIQPIVEHSFARQRAINTFKTSLSKLN